MKHTLSFLFIFLCSLTFSASFAQADETKTRDRLPSEYAYYYTGEYQLPVGFSFVDKKKIGEGGYGRVFRVQRDRDKKQFALKITKLDKDNKDLIDEECSACIADFSSSKLDHPQITKCYGSYADKTYIYTFFELFSKNLHNYIYEDMVFMSSAERLNKAVSILGQILNALSYLEKIGLRHNDLSSNNILLDEKGEHIALADFGASFSIESECILRILNVQNLSTPWFRSPEHFDRGNITQKDHSHIDVWAAACLFMFIYKGSPLYIWKHEHSFKIINPHIQDKNKRLPMELRDAGKDLQSLIISMLSPQPSTRPSAQEALAQLRMIPEYAALLPEEREEDPDNLASLKQYFKTLDYTTSPEEFNTVFSLSSSLFTHTKDPTPIRDQDTVRATSCVML